MTRKEQNKILDAKIESNVNQYKVDRMNAEISAFSSGDLNKYEFLTIKDLKYKSNALDNARFQFSPLGQTFSIGLDKTAKGYQEEGVMKLLKDIRDDREDINDNNDNDDNNDSAPDLETEEEAAKRIADYYKKIKDDYDDIILDLKTNLKIVNYQMKKKIN